MRLNLFLYILVSYLILVIVSTIYWANNFSSYTNYKGDEFFFYAEFLYCLTTLLFIVQILLMKVKRLLLLLFVPLLTILISVLLGFIFLHISAMNGTPSETIYIYSSVYSFINILILILTYKSSLKKKGIIQL